MKTENFLIAGNDIKMQECCKYIKSKGYEAKISNEDGFWSEFSEFKNIILPLPTESNGLLLGTGKDKESIIRKLKDNQRIFYGNLSENPFGVKGYCYYTDEDFLKYNSKLTAQGVLKIILDSIQKDITHLKIAVTGYGKCGEAIVKLLSANGADTTVFSRRKTLKPDNCLRKNMQEINSEICNYDIIINTVPYNIISNEAVESLNFSNLYIEVASKPYGFDYSSTDISGFKYINAYSLPGRYTSESAGQNIARTVIRMIEEAENE